MAQYNRNSSVSVTTTSVRVLIANQGRKALYIGNLTAGVTVTIQKGETAAIQNEGIVLSQGQNWFESNGENFECWKGEIQVIASGAGTIAVSEMFEA